MPRRSLSHKIGNSKNYQRIYQELYAEESMPVLNMAVNSIHNDLLTKLAQTATPTITRMFLQFKVQILKNEISTDKYGFLEPLVEELIQHFGTCEECKKLGCDFVEDYFVQYFYAVKGEDVKKNSSMFNSFKETYRIAKRLSYSTGSSELVKEKSKEKPSTDKSEKIVKPLSDFYSHKLENLRKVLENLEKNFSSKTVRLNRKKAIMLEKIESQRKQLESTKRKIEFAKMKLKTIKEDRAKMKNKFLLNLKFRIFYP